jgi:hypothetical protein
LENWLKRAAGDCQPSKKSGPASNVGIVRFFAPPPSLRTINARLNCGRDLCGDDVLIDKPSAHSLRVALCPDMEADVTLNQTNAQAYFIAGSS